jgi:archaellum component FlaC
MSGWDILRDTMKDFPPVATTIVLLAAAIVFIIGFGRNGMNFFKYGFGQGTPDSSLEKRFDDLADKVTNQIAGFRDEVKTELRGFKTELRGFKTELDGFKTDLGGFRTELGGFKTDLGGFKTELEAIKVNHFGHLKSYLRLLNGVLLDKNVVDNTMKARLDNELEGM